MRATTALLVFSLLAATTSCSGCSEEEPSDTGFTFDPRLDMDMKEADVDVGGGDAERPVDMPADVPETDGPPPVQSPGPMNGTWEVRNEERAEYVATLRLRHEEGETQVTGSVTMDEPPHMGPVGGGTYVNDMLSLSWTVVVDGSNETWGLQNCTFTDMSQAGMACGLNISIEGDIFDASLMKQ